MVQGVATLRKQTKQFITENPTSMVLTRRTRTPDGAGGYTLTSPTALGAQVVRVVQQTAAATVERQTVEGEVVRPEYKIVAEWDADIAEGDITTINGRRVEVVFINDIMENAYEKVAEVKII